ncbi:3-oxoacyl-ACP reductase [Variovorax sp. WS11]|uniref:SDR family NAD(P)-dependent oxidoreductase n=1 Tax=Variovorax sp. WS11 TaxID=1105204 RepID=UPI000D0C9F20|nr:SDR family NAD(P)-dependent oxidoreductase [Variovorax sp. WS11]NDZ18856.1 SDR family oxidoreductase [Variovorax sp. WS11]PSL79073.1 3-oxoacyl-ACP reductase [Variovorax sp. WS11]
MTSIDKNAAGWTRSKRVEGKVAVVFGGGQSAGEGIGNGRAACIRFAREGARVLVVNRGIDSAEETAQIIRDEGGEAFAFTADVTREDEIIAALVEAVRRWGSLDILHNNVGVSLAAGDGELVEISADVLDHQYRVNFRGIALACKHALPIMRQQRSGAIVNISSAAAVGLSPFAGYKAAKAAVNALTEQLALENAKYGIRINAIMPGLIATPMAVGTRSRNWNRSAADLIAERSAKVPLGKAGTSWDIANLALFLASDEASFITGECILVDGGRILNRI